MEKEPLGITFIVPDNQDAIGVYEAEGGVEVFETDEPYLLSDGKSLVDPMPVRMVDGTIYQDTLGNAQSALAITLVSSWSPADLFANGEQGSFWGPLPYYSDSAGTVEAGWGDPVGNIPDASGNGAAWTQVTSTSRPILGRVPVGGRRNLFNSSTPDIDISGTARLVSGVGFEVTKLADGLPSPVGNTAVRYEFTKPTGVEGYALVGGNPRAQSAGVEYRHSIYARCVSGTASVVYYTEVAGVTAIVTLGTEWVRLDRRSFRGSGDNFYRWLGVNAKSGIPAGTVQIELAGQQLETGSVATPYQRVGNAYDITEAGVKEIHYLRFDGTDDTVTTTLPAISGGTIVLAGTNGIWIDEIDFAGGEFSVGPDTYTGGPAGLMSILGDLLVEGGFVIDRALTPEEIAKVEGYYVARGSAGLIELGPELKDIADASSQGEGYINYDGLTDTWEGDRPNDGSSYWSVRYVAGGGVYLLDRETLTGGPLRLSNGGSVLSGGIPAGVRARQVIHLSVYPRWDSGPVGITTFRVHSVRRLIMPGDTP